MWKLSFQHCSKGKYCRKVRFCRRYSKIPNARVVLQYFKIFTHMFRGNRKFHKFVIPTPCTCPIYFSSQWYWHLPFPLFPQLIILVASTFQMTKGKTWVWVDSVRSLCLIEYKYNTVYKMFCLAWKMFHILGRVGGGLHNKGCAFNFRNFYYLCLA